MVCFTETKGLKYNKVPDQDLKFFTLTYLRGKSDLINVLQSLEYQGINPNLTLFQTQAKIKQFAPIFK
jgi:hypothetical protein